MKKIINLITIMIIAFVSSMDMVSAATSYPSKISVSSIGKLNYGAGYYFPVKYLSDGTLGYCTEFYDNYPMGVVMSNPKKLNAGLTYIIDNGFKGTKADYSNTAKMKEYYITQLAIYTFLGQANPSSTTEVGKDVWALVNGAKKAADETAKLNVTLNASSTTMKLTSDKKHFISEAITVKANYSNVSFKAAVSTGVGATLVDVTGKEVSTLKSGSVVYIKVPESVINAGQSVTLSMAIKGVRTVKSAYVYQPSQSTYQNIIPSEIYTTQEVAEAKLSVKASKDKISTKVKISKQDITTKKELPGAKLEVKDASGKVVAAWTSTNTAVYVNGLTPGKYTLCETVAPEGYKLKTECINFEVYADGRVSSVIMYNEPVKIETVAKISKQDVTTKKELPGAKLEIKDASGKTVASWTSGTSPKYVKGLAAGEYTLCETAAPAGYELYTECIKFTVFADGTTSNVIMYNKPIKEEVIETSVKVSKQDITNNKELPGAKLEVKDASGKVIAAWTSTNTPKLIKGLKAGNYTLCETAAPLGYELYTECIKFTVFADGTTSTVIMYNKPIRTEVVVKPTLSITKIDSETRRSLAGAKLQLMDSKGNVVDTFTTTDKPKVYTSLNAGKYTLKELEAPAGYVLSNKTVEITLEQGKTTNVTFENTKKPVVVEKITKLEISKQDITTKKELPGASLVIKDASGKVVESWVSTTKPKYIEGLKAGNYTLCETTAPAGYVLKTECIKFTLTADNTVKSVVMYNERTKDPEVVEKVTKVEISKQDITTKKELPGASLVIKDASGKVVESWVSTTKPKYIEGLKAGEYTLCETAAPTGYTLKTECIKFTLTADNKVKSVVMFNERTKEPVVEKITKVEISKQDITTKKELPGAKLEVKDASGKVVESWVSTNDPKYIEGLIAGDYTLCETAAPAGYVLKTECINFTLTADNTVKSVVMFNERIKEEVEEEIIREKVKISKQDIATKTELPGATLVIKDASGKEVERWVSTNEALYFELPAGVYTLEEVEAPTGYILSMEKITFEVLEDGSCNDEIIMFNSKEVDVPITSASASALMYLTGFVGMLFGAIKINLNAKLQ